VKRQREYLQTTKNLKITHINNWLKETFVLCKSEEMLMEAESEPRFAQGPGLKSCCEHRLCIWAFIQFCSAGKNFASQVLWATPTLPDTTGHRGLKHPPEDHLCCLVVSMLRGTAWARVKQHVIPRQIPSGDPGCTGFAQQGFGS